MRPDRVFRSEEITFVISFHQSDEQIPRALALQMYTISHLMHLLTHKNLVPIGQNSTVDDSMPIDEGEDCGSRFAASPGWSRPARRIVRQTSFFPAWPWV